MSDEKNIHVTRGIPVTPSVSGSGASHYSSFSLGLSNGHYADDHHAGDQSFAYFGERENRESQIKAAYADRYSALAQVVSAELAAIKLESDVPGLSPIDVLMRESMILHSLISAKKSGGARAAKCGKYFLWR